MWVWMCGWVVSGHWYGVGGAHNQASQFFSNFFLTTPNTTRTPIKTQNGFVLVHSWHSIRFLFLFTRIFCIQTHNCNNGKNNRTAAHTRKNLLWILNYMEHLCYIYSSDKFGSQWRCVHSKCNTIADATAVAAAAVVFDTD